MAITRLRGQSILDGSILREDLDVSTPGSAVIRKVIAGSGMRSVSTGVDSGTGDVTITTYDGFPGVTVQYTNNKVSSILYYSDAAKTALVRKVDISYSGEFINTIITRDGSNAILETKTLSYDGSNNVSGSVIS